jgi:hypothetical protein
MPNLSWIFRIPSNSFLRCTLAGIIACLVPLSTAAQTTYLDQGWTEKDRQWWYSTSQGARLLPLSWMLALEQANSPRKFLSPENVRRLGYLLDEAATDGLPIGFAKDTGPAPDNSSEPWLGMTCAACHTGELTYGNRRVRIDGAPTLADFQTFMEEMLASLKTTRKDSVKLGRFLQHVLGGSASAADRNDLIAKLD